MEETKINESGEIIAGLDIGTTKICVVVGEVFADRIEIIGVGTASSSGMRKGVVVNIESTVEAIKKAVKEAEEMAQCHLEYVYVGIAGNHIKGFNSPGIVAINNQQIGEKDVEAVIRAARTVKLSDNQQIIHVIPQEYMVDDHTGIQSPIGMTGVRLVTNVHIVTAGVNAIHNLTTCCNHANLVAQEIVLESIAGAEAVLTREEMNTGVILLDIGGGTTDLAVFHNGSVKHTWELPLGGNNLTSDLSVGLRTPLQDAEELKYSYGGALSSMVKDNHVIEIPTMGERKTRKISQRVTVEILEARIEEILEFANQNVTSSGMRNRINSGVVITGGTALLANIADLAEQIFEMPVRIGYPTGVTGLLEKINSPRCSTAVGLLLHGSRKRKKVDHSQMTFIERLKLFFRQVM